MTFEQLMAQYGANPYGARGQLYQQGREADAAQAGLGYYTPQSEGTGTFRYNDPRFNEAGRFTDPNGQMQQLVGQYFRRADGAAPNMDDAARLFNDPSQVQYDPDFGFYTGTDNFKPNQERDPIASLVAAAATGALGYGAGATAGLWGGGAGAGGGGYSSLPTMPYNPAAPALNPMTNFSGGGMLGGGTLPLMASNPAAPALNAFSAAPNLSGGGLLGGLQNAASGLLNNATSNPLNAIRTISGLTNMVQGIRGGGSSQPSGGGGGKSGGGTGPTTGTVQRPQFTPNPYTQQQLQQYNRLGI